MQAGFEVLPGQRVRVTQQVRWGASSRNHVVEGRVQSVGQERTGSWFAHSKDHKLWLDRIRLEKDDGELIALNLDQYSRIELLEEAAGESA